MKCFCKYKCVYFVFFPHKPPELQPHHKMQFSVISREPSVVVKVLSCCEFELQSSYYVHFQTNAPWKKYKSLYL